MVQETEIYDEKDSIFKSVCDGLTSIKTYHVSANNGADLNTNNLEIYLKDPKYGIISLGEDKYPICVCLAPKSKVDFVSTGETFFFTMFFLKQSGIDNINSDTNQSENIPSDDWVEMKNAAADFWKGLIDYLKTDYNPDMRWSSIFQLGYREGINITRITNFSGDKLSGVIINFAALFQSLDC